MNNFVQLTVPVHIYMKRASSREWTCPGNPLINLFFFQAHPSAWWEVALRFQWAFQLFHHRASHTAVVTHPTQLRAPLPTTPQRAIPPTVMVPQPPTLERPEPQVVNTSWQVALWWGKDDRCRARKVPSVKKVVGLPDRLWERESNWAFC